MVLKTYDGLVNYGYKEHFRVRHSNNEFILVTIILMELKIFGDFVKLDYHNLEEYTNIHFIYTLKNANLGIIAATKIYT